ncbi:MAG: hypothetical protein QNJ62_05090 [Methyloceanibacter sp.]|nr:hypothetical protein [Methyloceanibacter sp.]
MTKFMVLLSIELDGGFVRCVEADGYEIKHNGDLVFSDIINREFMKKAMLPTVPSYGLVEAFAAGSWYHVRPDSA